MNAKRHMIASLPIAMVSLPFNQSVPFLTVELFGFQVTVFLLCLVLGVFVDIDHIIDYRLNKQRMRKNLGPASRRKDMFVFPFHGVESIAILVALSFIFPFLAFPTVSYACHMIMDIHGNGHSLASYFYVVRFGRKLAY